MTAKVKYLITRDGRYHARIVVPLTGLRDGSSKFSQDTF